METPQPEQHFLINKMAKSRGGKIVFYGNEDLLSYKKQPFILIKLVRSPNLDGVVFFTINQFCYNKIFNLKKMFEIIDLGFSIHFARENLSFNSFGEIKNKYVELSSYFNNFKRLKEKKLSFKLTDIN